MSNNFRLVDSFQSAMLDYFGAKAQNVDFGIDQTRIEINNWVEQITRQMIKNFLPDGLATVFFVI